MLSKSRLRRRWIGGLALMLSLGFLILGETALKGCLTPGGFLIYWLICFLLTVIAITVAFLDVRDLGRSTVHEHRDLLDKTLQEIEAEARRRKNGGNGSG
jgi:hypothetical protein